MTRTPRRRRWRLLAALAASIPILALVGAGPAAAANTIVQTEPSIPVIAAGGQGDLTIDISSTENFSTDTNLPTGVTFLSDEGSTLVSPTEVKTGPFPNGGRPSSLTFAIQVASTAMPGSTLTATVPSTVTGVDGTVSSIFVTVKVAPVAPGPLANLWLVGGVAGLLLLLTAGWMLRRRHVAAARP